jgi:hypothetical protein
MPGMPGDPFMLSAAMIAPGGAPAIGQGALLAGSAAGGLRALPLGGAGNPGLLGGAAHPAQLAQFGQHQGLDARAWCVMCTAQDRDACSRHRFPHAWDAARLRLELLLQHVCQVWATQARQT